jgi:hypothetical protein
MPAACRAGASCLVDAARTTVKKADVLYLPGETGRSRSGRTGTCRAQEGWIGQCQCYCRTSAGLFLSLAVLGVRDCVRGVASRNWSTVARGVALLIAAVASVIVSYRVWIWSVGPSSP